jgi:hypothetical protein
MPTQTTAPQTATRTPQGSQKPKGWMDWLRDSLEQVGLGYEGEVDAPDLVPEEPDTDTDTKPADDQAHKPPDPLAMDLLTMDAKFLERSERDQRVWAGDEADDNHLDLCAGKSEVGASFKANKDRAAVKAAATTKSSLVQGSLKQNKQLGYGFDVEGESEGDLGMVECGVEGSARAGWDGVAGEAMASSGVYAGKAGGKVSGGYKIPGLNARVGLSAKAEGAVGLGVKAGLKGKLDSSGGEWDTEFGSTLGVGGSWGVGGFFKKANADAGWLEPSAAAWVPSFLGGDWGKSTP